MSDSKGHRARKAYENPDFLASREGRLIRILSEYVEPKARFEHHRIDDTVVFMGSARTPSREEADKVLAAAKAGEADMAQAEAALKMSEYYEASRALAKRLTEWSKSLEDKDRRFVVCTGGGPGIMEAANRGASEASGLNVGLGISLPVEQYDNDYITRELSLHFHYFFMRKFWFAYLAKAMVIMPGGFGTLDELFEVLTLVQTHKIRKRMPIILFGTDYWDEVFNLDALVKWGTINADDLDLLYRTNSVDDAFDYLKRELSEHEIGNPGAKL